MEGNGLVLPHPARRRRIPGEWPPGQGSARTDGPQGRRFAQPGDNGLVFTSPAGRPLRHSQFRARVWVPALAKLGLTDLHFHDLRHADNDLAAASGATLRELMARMGHSTTRAALIYLHDSDDRQRKIAESLDALLRGQLAGGNPADGRGS